MMFERVPRTVSCFAMALTACAAFSWTAAANTITIAAGPELGAYSSVATALKVLVNNAKVLGKDRLSVVPTDGSVANLKGLRAGRYQLAIVQTDQALDAFNGTGALAGEGPFTHLRAVLGLHGEALALVVRKDAGIRSLDDLKGKTVDAGLDDSGQRAVSLELLQKYGATIAATNGKTGTAGLCEGTLDGALFLMGQPSTRIADALWRCHAHLVPVGGSVVEEILQQRPALYPTVIPGGLYPFEPNDVPAIGVRAILVTRDDVGGKTVGALVGAVLRDPWLFRNLDPVLSSVTDADLVPHAEPLPLHTAAARAFEKAKLK
jgi:uncharacterized protein